MPHGMLLIYKIMCTYKNMNNIKYEHVYNACGPFTRQKERIKEFKCTGDTRYIYRNELDKACFQHNSAYADHKDLINRTEADNVLRDKAYDIASNAVVIKEV